MARSNLFIQIVSLAGLMLFSACDGNVTPRPGDGPGKDGGIDPQFPPFEAVALESYTAKVKTMLTGLPVTSEELASVRADRAQLKALAETWLETPEAKAKLLVFFSNALQQTQFGKDDLFDQLGKDLDGQASTSGPLLANLQESMARTVLMMIDEGRPLTEAVTTRSFMMTTALMSLYARADNMQITDAFNANDLTFNASNPARVTVTNSTVIPVANSIDPSHPNYMKWSVPQSFGPNCTTEPRVYTNGQQSVRLWGVLMGRIPADPNDNMNCRGLDVTPVFKPGDFTDWRKVTIAPPANLDHPTLEGPTTRFFDVPSIRATSTLVTKTARVGFFSTMAFFANWPTNSSNDARVVTNQMLIVALGKSFDPADSTTPVSESGLDGEHADPSTSCYACHKSLDPMRQFFRKTYTYGYGRQRVPALKNAEATFQFAGVTSQGQQIDDLALTLTRHPLFAPAWVEKLCFYLNSSGCNTDDAEFQRVVTDFQTNGHDFKKMLVDLASSPLVTGASETKTFTHAGIVASIARYDHFCASLSNRLGIRACNFSGPQTSLALQLPADSYSRGAESPILNSDTSLFHRGTTENLCRNMASQVVDVASGPFKTTQLDASIKALAQSVMGLPDNDERSELARVILREHYERALATGATKTDSLRSTFMLACQSPSSVSVGL